MTPVLSAYSQIVSRLKKAGIQDDPLQWRGFVLGLVCRGFEPQSRKFLSVAAVAMNGGSPLPAEAAAVLRELAAEDVQKLGQQGDPLWYFAEKSLEPEQCLQGLADLCLGLSLGLSFRPEGGMSAGSRELQDFLRSLSEISRVDTGGEFDREDAECVLGYIRETLQQIWQKKLK